MNEETHRVKNHRWNVTQIVRRLGTHQNAILGVVLIALIVVLGILTKGVSVSASNVRNVLVQASILGVSAIGQALVILTAGIDLTVGGLGSFCSVLGVGLMTRTPMLSLVNSPFSIYQALPVLLLAGIGFGAFNGLLVSRIGLPPLIVTLAMWKVLQGLTYIAGGSQTVANLPSSLSFWGGGVTVAGVPVPVIIFFMVAAIMYFILNYTPFGRSVYALGCNPVSSWLSGIRIRHLGIIVYMVSGFLAAVTGILTTGRIMSASMNTLSGHEIRTVASVSVGGISLMGGKGDIIGAVLGILIVTVTSNGIRMFGGGSAAQYILLGSIIFGAVAADLLRRR